MKHIFKALSAFQKECPVIHKGTQGYGYTYADLPAIFEVINPILEKYGLGFTQLICGKCVKTILFHIESGEVLESNTDIPQGVSLAKMNEFQVLGSSITYIRRYALSSMLGIITDKDTDAHGEQKVVTPPQKVVTPPQLLVQNSKDILVQNSKNWHDVIIAMTDGKDGKIYTLNEVERKYTIPEKTKEVLLEIVSEKELA